MSGNTKWLNWLDCVKLYDKDSDELNPNLSQDAIELYHKYKSRIGSELEYNVWYDTISPKCIGADETYKNSIVANEASFLTSRRDFLFDPRWGVSGTRRYSDFLTTNNFVMSEDGWYENIPEVTKYKDSSILIVGGGPSSNLCEWKDDDSDFVWTCNHFYNHEKIMQKEVSLTYLNAETYFNIPSLAAKILEDKTICAADTSITRPPGLLRGFKESPVTTLLFNNRVFLTSGAVPKLISLAVLFGAKKISFVGMDGWRKEQIDGFDASDHAFEPGKKLKISSNYTFDFQRRETVVYWDFFLNNAGKNVIFQNLGETYEHNMSSGISKLAFPLK